MSMILFVLAAIASVGLLALIVYLNVQKLIKDPEQAVNVQKKFLGSVLLSKIIPVGLLIFGIAKLTTVENISELFFPWFIIFVSLVVGLIFTTRLKKLAVEEEAQAAVNALISMARPLFISIPLVSAIFLYLMIP